MTKLAPFNLVMPHMRSESRFTMRYFCECRCLFGPFNSSVHNVIFITVHAIYFAALTAGFISLLSSQPLSFQRHGIWNYLLVAHLVCYYFQSAMMLLRFFCSEPNPPLPRPGQPRRPADGKEMWLLAAAYVLFSVFRIGCSVLYFLKEVNKCTALLMFGEILSIILFSSCILRCFNIPLPSKLITYIDSTVIMDSCAPFAKGKCAFCCQPVGLYRSKGITFHPSCVARSSLSELIAMFGAGEGRKGELMSCRCVDGKLAANFIMRNIDEQMQDAIVSLPYTCFCEGHDFFWVDYSKQDSSSPDTVAIIKNPTNSEILQTLLRQGPTQILNAGFSGAVCCFAKSTPSEPQVTVVSKFGAIAQVARKRMDWRQGEIVNARWVVGVKKQGETAIRISRFDLLDMEAEPEVTENVELAGKRFFQERRPDCVFIDGYGYIELQALLAAPEINIVVLQ